MIVPPFYLVYTMNRLYQNYDTFYGLFTCLSFSVRSKFPVFTSFIFSTDTNSNSKRELTKYLLHKEKKITALASVAQWIECLPVNQKVASLIPR